MIDQDQVSAVQGCTVYESGGEKIGRAGQIYLDDQTGRPEWVTVSTGLLGIRESFVPLHQAMLSGDRLVVPYQKDMIKDAPSVNPGSHLDESEEAELYRHYGLPYGAEMEEADTGLPSSPGETDDAMTRSEEELRVGTEKVERGRVRLRKYVTTEQQTVNVPISREEVRVVREPVTEQNFEAAMSGPEITEAEHEVVLHEERPVVEKKVEPVERVRLEKQAFTDEEAVSAEVRKEHLEVEDESGLQHP